MVMRKITVDKSVIYIPRSEKLGENKKTRRTN